MLCPCSNDLIKIYIPSIMIPQYHGMIVLPSGCWPSGLLCMFDRWHREIAGSIPSREKEVLEVLDIVFSSCTDQE